MRVLKIAGLQNKLSYDHPLINLLKTVNKDKYISCYLQNCIGSISRVFCHVQKQMEKAEILQRHWSDLLLQYKFVIEYFDAWV